MSLIDSAALIVTPNGYKEGKLYSVIPSDGSGDMSVVRATTATRVNSAGLVELVPYNLVSYSEQFDNAAWPVQDSAVVTANTTTAPNGTTTADTISFGVTPFSSCYQSVTNGAGTFTFSIYAKCASGTQSFKFIMYNPTDGQIDSTIFTVTTEWQRFQYSFTVTQNSNWFIANANDGVIRSIFIWGAQLNEGSTAKDYQKTETRLNIPRLDYSNGTCPSLLVEPQRTNLVTYSSSFDNAAWYKDNISNSANSVNSPSGIQDADSILETAINATHTTYNRASMTSGQAYTQSCFFKANGRNRVIMQIFDNATQYGNAIFDLSTGVVVDSSGGATIQEFENGWYRCTITGTSPATGLGYCVIGLCENTYSTPSVFPSYLGDVTKGVYAWGFQTELGSYQTSYIPTTSASVTRNADVISKTGISSLIGQTEGTIFVDIDLPNNSANDIFTFFDTAVNDIFLASNGGNLIARIYNNSTPLFFAQFPITSAGGRFKMAISYKSGDSSFYVNGTLLSTNTNSISFTSTLNTINLTNNVYAGLNNKEFNSVALWKTRLTNAQLATLTTI